MNTVHVPLTKPINIDGKEVTELSFREAEVGDLLDAEVANTEMSRLVAVLASISGIPIDAFKKISARDFRTIMARCKDLVGNETSQTTGAA